MFCFISFISQRYKILFVYVPILIQYSFLLYGSKPIFSIQMNHVLNVSSSDKLLLERIDFLNMKHVYHFYGAWTVQVDQQSPQLRISHTYIFIYVSPHL